MPAPSPATRCRLAVAGSLLPLAGLLGLFQSGVCPALGDPNPLLRGFPVLPALGVVATVAGAAVVWCATAVLARTVKEGREQIATATEWFDGAYRELEATNARLREFSFKDDVTGLYNRRFFSIRLDEEINRYRRYGRPIAVVLLDLDGFKTVNDRMGHAAGDETLRGVAHLLTEHTRDTNIVCRYGGDEFAVLLVETTGASARLYADRLRQLIAQYPFAHACTVSASFGVASVPDDVAASSDEIVRCADEALYAAKRAGKNTVSARADAGAEGAEAVAGGAEGEIAAAAGGRSS